MHSDSDKLSVQSQQGELSIIMIRLWNEEFEQMKYAKGRLSEQTTEK